MNVALYIQPSQRAYLSYGLDHDYRVCSHQLNCVWQIWNQHLLKYWGRPSSLSGLLYLTLTPHSNNGLSDHEWTQMCYKIKVFTLLSLYFNIPVSLLKIWQGWQGLSIWSTIWMLDFPYLWYPRSVLGLGQSANYCKKCLHGKQQQPDKQQNENELCRMTPWRLFCSFYELQLCTQLKQLWNESLHEEGLNGTQDLNFTTAKVVYITAIINHIFISFAFPQFKYLSNIHFALSISLSLHVRLKSADWQNSANLCSQCSMKAACNSDFIICVSDTKLYFATRFATVHFIQASKRINWRLSKISWLFENIL